MFGNIKPNKGEMKIKDYTNYRAYYCGLCKSMGKRYAGLCNFGLSYEAVFIAIVMSALSDEEVVLKRQRCFVHPFTKSPMVVHNSSVDRSAAINVLLIYNSLCDNIRDENDFKSKLGKLWFGAPYKRAAKELSETDDRIKIKLDELAMLEEGLCDVMEMVAQPFAEMMGQIAVDCTENKSEELYWFGFFMGKWLYFIDAFADIEKDVKNNSYNPFVRVYKDLPAEEIISSAREDAQFLLENAMTEIGRLYDRLDIKRNKEIIENILFVGMPQRTADVLACKKVSKPKGEYKMQE